MAASPSNHVIRYLRRVVLRDDATKTDGELLASFIEKRDEAAFECLVSRYGPMVWSVCRRVLARDQDAEDVFQATFLILVRKAASIVPRGMVANWLYGVAHQSALQARRNAARRTLKEKQVAVLPEPSAACPDHWYDLRPVLDRELSRLPNIYRAVLVLCDMEGKTRKEAARHLGWPEGTVAGRLPRARALLVKRLRRHGLVLSNASLAAALLQNAATADLPNALISSTAEAAASFSAGTMAIAGLISTEVADLTRGVLHSMFLTKLKTLAAAFVLTGALAGGLFTITGLGADRSAASNETPRVAPTQPPVTPPQPQVDELLDLNRKMRDLLEKRHKADLELDILLSEYARAARKAATAKFVQETKLILDHLPDVAAGKDKKKTLEALDGIEKALRQAREEIKNDGPSHPNANKTQFDGLVWGNEVNGLQLGIGLTPGYNAVYGPGDKIDFVLKLRNLSKTAIKYVFQAAPFEAAIPNVEIALPRTGSGRKSSRPGPDADHLPYTHCGVSMPFEVSKRASIEMEIAPGEVIEIGKQRIALWGPLAERGSAGPSIPALPGKYRISYANVIQIGPTVSTPAIEIEVKDPKVNTDKIIGAWILVREGLPRGYSIEFTKDGKWTRKIDLNGKASSLGGFYKINDNTLTLTSKTPDGEESSEKTITITTLTDSKFVFIDPEGTETEFKRDKMK